MFSKSTLYYDMIYEAKDYASESQRLVLLIHQQVTHDPTTLLDVACGSGRHIEYLKSQFNVQGMDINPDLLETARQRNPGVPFHVGDMRDFDLGQRFDVVTCLFSAIGYMKTLEELNTAVNCMARHVRSGGRLVIEPWFTPESWFPGRVHAVVKEVPNLKVVRMNASQVDGRVSWFDFHYLVGTPAGVEHFVERHELGVFTVEEMKTAFKRAGLHVIYDPDGLTGRGLYIGIKPDQG